MRGCFIIAQCVALLVLGIGSREAGADLITIELKAVGPYTDPHNITVSPGTPVRLVYEISAAEDLAMFQNSVSITGSVSSIGATMAGTWWGSEPTTSLQFQYQSVTGLYILLGETLGQPWSYSSPAPVTLSFFDITPSASTVVIDGLGGGSPMAVNMWMAAGSEDYGDPHQIDVDFQRSNMVVTIHTAEVVIPEPATLIGLGAGLAGLAIRRRRAKQLRIR